MALVENRRAIIMTTTNKHIYNFWNFLDVTGSNLYYLQHNHNKPVHIYVLDSGYNYNNDFGFSNVDTTYDAIARTIRDDDSDDTGHGTHVIDIIQTIHPDVFIHPIKVTQNDMASGLSIDNAFAYLKTIQQQGESVDIVCCSFGSDAPINKLTHRHIAKMYANNTIFVASIGNGGRNYAYSPASLPEFISVGGLDSTFENRWKNSNYSRETDVMALAENIQIVDDNHSPVNDELLSGTSFANAIAVGQIALLLSNGHIDTKESLLELTQRYSSETRKLETAYGYLDLNKLVNKPDKADDTE